MSGRQTLKETLYALDFPGSNDYVDFGDTFDRAHDEAFAFTFEFYPRDGANQQTIFQKRDNTAEGWEVGFATAGDSKLRFVLESTNGNAIIVDSPIIPLKRWSEITVSYDGSGLVSGVKMMRNGVEMTLNVVQSQNISVGISNSTDMRWGLRDNGSADGNFKLGNVRFHNAAVTLAQHQAGYFNNVYSNVEEYWPGSEGSGSSITGSILSTVGTLTNDVMWDSSTMYKTRSGLTTRRSGVLNVENSLYINGSTGYVDIGEVYDKDGSEAFAVSCWVYLAGSGRGTNRTIFSKQIGTGDSNGWLLRVDTADELSFFLINDVIPVTMIRVDSVAAMPHNVWCHVVASYDGSKTAAGVTLYCNSSAMADTDVFDSLGAASSTSPGVNFAIGYRESDTGQIMNGYITHARIHNAQQTAAKVADLYYDGIAVDVEAEWLMTDGSGTTLTASVGGQNGTITTPDWRSGTVPRKSATVLSSNRTVLS